MGDGIKALKLRRLTQDQYAAGDSDPVREGANRLRAIMGQRDGMEQTGPLPFDALASSETVDVSVPEPSTDYTPRDLDAVYLGTRTSPPTGTYTPPGVPARPAPKIGAAVGALWNRVRERYPYAERFVSDLDADTLSPNVAGVHLGNGKIRLDLKHGMDEDTLIHELTHAAHGKQFTHPDDNAANYGKGGGAWGADYTNRRGERIARRVERDAARRATSEFYTRKR